MLEWFTLFKEHSLRKSTNLRRNNPILFLTKKRRSADVDIGNVNYLIGNTPIFCQQLGSGVNPRNFLYFQGIGGSKLLMVA